MAADGGDGHHPPPVDISFHNLKFSVRSRDQSTNETIQILKGITGRCLSGRVTAIMGSSGAGKTTLLDVLAGTNFGGTVEGDVLVNGQPRRRSEFAKLSCYVMQRDVLLASSTVREAVAFAADLKLPWELGRAAKAAAVDSLLEELDLTGCKDQLIGDELLNMKGISGGQRRRVSVALELVKDPRVVFLDEPTSGLDSEMAVSLVETLVALSRRSRTVVLTIHQPNSLITSHFDDFLLLAGGSVVFSGPYAGAVGWFEGQGYPCPQYTNPTDHFLAVLRAPETAAALTAAFEKESGSLEAPPDLEAAGGGADGALEVTAPPARQAAAGPSSRVPFHYQLRVLARRMLRMWVRNPMMLFSEAAQYGFIAVFTGLMYLQVNNSVATGVSDRAASMWFALAVLSFTPSYTSVTLWDRDRVLLRRETAQGMFSVQAWFTARTLVTWPMEIIQTFIFTVIMYWMVGYVAKASNFFIFVAAYGLFMLCAESVGVLASAVTSSSTYAILVLTFVLLFLLSFSGFLVSAVPVYFRWISKISFLTYAYAAVVTQEFDDVTFVGENGQAIPGSLLIPPQISNGLSVGVNLLILLGITLVTRALAFLAIYGAARFKYL